ncbi:MAG TPA: hypothetical protein VM243_17295 [Phycisphaerae bacterium]|nr:hypothetical protein [Phycisphaerae bacterium]
MSDSVARTHEAIARLFERLGETWCAVDTEELTRTEQTALRVICWTGLVELRLTFAAWTDVAQVSAEAVVCGQWIDSSHASMLPERLRAAIPAWAGRSIAMQPDPCVQARLTSDGLDVQRDVSSGNEASRFCAFAAATCNLQPGRARVRILSTDARAPGVVPALAADGPNELVQALKTGFADVAQAIRGAGGVEEERTRARIAESAKKATSPDPHRDDWNALTERQRICLQALDELGAFDASSRQRAGDVAQKAEGHSANVNGFKQPLADLAKRGLIESKTGREGGYWLSPNGRAVIKAGDRSESGNSTDT